MSNKHLILFIAFLFLTGSVVSLSLTHQSTADSIEDKARAAKVNARRADTKEDSTQNLPSGPDSVEDGNDQSRVINLKLDALEDGNGKAPIGSKDATEDAHSVKKMSAMFNDFKEDDGLSLKAKNY